MRGRGHARLARALEILREAGHATRLIPTHGPGSGGEIARHAIAEGAELILVAGGDGTINEVAEGVAFSNVPLGVLPAGTANVLATEMGVTARMDRAAAGLPECVPTRVSMGRLHYLNGDGGQRTRLFLMMAGIGLDATIVSRLSMPLKARIGKLAYYITGFSLLGRDLEEFEVEVEGRRVLCSFALVSKVRNYGGDLEIAQTISLLDDQFEVVLFEGRSTFRYLKYLARVAAHKVAGLEGVSLIRTSGACVSGAVGGHVLVQADGELTGHLPARMEIVPDALTLMIPEGYIRKRGR